MDKGEMAEQIVSLLTLLYSINASPVCIQG